MTKEPPFYSTFSLFGKEHEKSVCSSDLFEDLVACIFSFFGVARCPIKCRGLIFGEQGKNIAPRRGLIKEKKIQEWLSQMEIGRFMDIEIFDGAWSNTVFPSVYGAIHRIWGYSPQGMTKETEVGAENAVTIAVRRDVLSGDLSLLEELAKEIGPLIDVFYGFIESSIQWDIPTKYGTRTNLMDVRYHDRTGLDFRRGQYKMDELIPRLYWGNVLSPLHIKNGQLDALPKRLISIVEPWSDRLTYVRFARDPQLDPDFHDQISGAFNLIPEPDWLRTLTI